MNVTCPVPGPWNQFRPRRATTTTPSDPVVIPAGAQTQQPPYRGGPLLLGPFVRTFSPRLLPSAPATVPPPPPPSVTDLLYIDHMTGRDVSIERLRRATQKLAMIANSLIRKRILVFEGDVNWTIDVTAALDGPTGTFTDSF